MRFDIKVEKVINWVMCAIMCPNINTIKVAGCGQSLEFLGEEELIFGFRVV